MNGVGRDNLQAASKKAGDPYLGKLRRQESLDLSRRGIGKEDLEGESVDNTAAIESNRSLKLLPNI